jgi:putative membrane protein
MFPGSGVISLLVIAAVIILVAYLLSQRNTESRSSPLFHGTRRETETEESALDILKKRYAKGEIDKEQFDRMKRDIEE